MDNDPTDKISSYINELTERFKFPRLNLRWATGLKTLAAAVVLVRYFKYSPEIQKNIEEKKLQDQMVFTNQPAARTAREEAELKEFACREWDILEKERWPVVTHPDARRKGVLEQIARRAMKEYGFVPDFPIGDFRI